jgi:hypothetical protein
MEQGYQPNQAPQEVVHQERMIIGEVVIGEIDPRTLTEKEFNLSPNLLFHGAAKEFDYSPSGEYDVMDTGGDGTSDYGAGFYATDNKREAENYSSVRSNGSVEQPLVYPFLPDHARMLDVRDVLDPDNNGVLPREFVKSWLDYLRSHTSNEQNYAHLSEFLKENLRDGTIKYFLDPLQAAYDSGAPIAIRADREELGIFARDRNGLIDIAFQEFMKSKGYDGMIYRESSEGKRSQNLTGYVFYNYKAIDTWKGWQKRAAAGE